MKGGRDVRASSSRTNPDHARANDAILTEEGWEKVGHVQTVQQLVFDGLTGDDVTDLARVCGRVLGQLECGPQGGQ